MKTEISTIIFSKNRACQLELLLRNFNMPAVVIYTHDPEFKAGYEKLMGMYPSIKFIFQDNLKKQIIENLGEYTMFEVDDAVMLEPFSEDCPEFAEFKKNPDILCLSLRMCPHYTRGGTPVFKNNTWKWKGLKHSWGYPMSVSSTIFRKADILPIIEKIDILEIPHHLEGALRRNPPKKPLMLCFDEPKLITNEANIVQSVFPTPNFGVDLKDLEERFLKGERLSFEYMRESAKKAIDCFMRMNYEWEHMKENKKNPHFAEATRGKNNWLVEYRKSVTSQNGEDGVLEKIFEVLGIEKGWCVDVGARGIQLSNTYNLMQKGWSGVFLEASNGYFRRLKKIYRDFPAYCLNAFVAFSGEKSLDNLLSGTPIPKNFDFLTIDIDGNDYYIWESLKNYSPTVVCIEFNPVKKLDDYVQEVDGKGGTSLSFMTKLAKKKGYELIFVFGANAIFVKKELFEKFGIEDNSVKEMFGDNIFGYGSGRDKKNWSPDQSKEVEKRESGYSEEVKKETNKQEEIKNKNNWLNEYAKNITSQNGEDGVLEKIFEVLGVEKGWCVDVGACGVHLSNTYSLIMKGWSGVFIDADRRWFKRLLKTYQGLPVYPLNDFVVPSGEKSLDNILQRTPMPKNFDFLSIDIDGNDYYIWESLKNYTPAVVVIEFNGAIKFDDYVQPIDGHAGASLSYFIKLGKQKGYELISALGGGNAFFVRKDLFAKFEIVDNSAQEIWTEVGGSYGGDTTKYSMPEVKNGNDGLDENGNDITIIYYTANKISDYFFENSKKQLLKAAGDIPIISVSQKPIELGKNICVGDIGQSVFNIYKQALIGAKEAKTKYIAMAEDDILYSPEHFTKRSSPKTFAYNLGIQAIFTWSNPPIFSYIGRQVLSNLICERQLFIDAMEERHTKYPKDEDKPIKHWGEPGRCDKELGVTRRSVENIYTDIPNVVFSHQDSLCYQTLGKRKAHGRDRVEEIPYWGKARDVIHNFYKKPEGVDYVAEKFKVDLTQPSPIMLPINRSLGFPELLKELGIKKGVEIGVYEGNYLETLKNKMPNLDLIGVDAWQPYEGYRDYGPSHIVNAMEKAKIRAEKNGTTLIRAFSAEASKQFKNESLDFIYIDANHDFAHVIEDLNAWNPKIKKGGIISGSGFFKSKWTRHGVWHAIQAWCKYVNVPLFVMSEDETPSWFYIKP